MSGNELVNIFKEKMDTLLTYVLTLWPRQKKKYFWMCCDVLSTYAPCSKVLWKKRWILLRIFSHPHQPTSYLKKKDCVFLFGKICFKKTSSRKKYTYLTKKYHAVASSYFIHKKRKRKLSRDPKSRHEKKVHIWP